MLAYHGKEAVVNHGLGFSTFTSAAALKEVRASVTLPWCNRETGVNWEAGIKPGLLM
jgi:hypothetical protein